MSIQRPSQFDQIQRIQPIFRDSEEGDQHNRSQHKKVYYQGRSWGESEEELPILPTSQPRQLIQNPLEKPPIYADFELYKIAKKQFESLTTIPEKMAQICFLRTEASYDQQVFHEAKNLIQNFQIGGLLFTEGEYKRQTYLIEHYQTLSKTPLLIGNDFYHGLSFFLPEPFKDHNQQRYYDLGKVIMLQNLRMGVHFQCDQALKVKEKGWLLDGNDRGAFRKGIRVANGVVGKFQTSDQAKRKRWIPQFSIDKGSITAEISSGVEDEINEILGLKTVEFLDLTALDQPLHNEDWIELFLQSKELFLFSKFLPNAIEVLSQAVVDGIIGEEELDKKVFKALLVKAFFA